jgi:hypothetical protein
MTIIKRHRLKSRVKKEDTSMPVCKLCSSSYFGRGNVCAPLGDAGDRCCDQCNTALVIPARVTETRCEKRPPSTSEEDLHIKKRFRSNPWTCNEDDDDCDDDEPLLSAASAVTGRVDDGLYVSSEQATDECAPGIEFERPAVLHGLSVAKCAVKPPCPTTRPEDMPVDVYVGFDNTYSMRGDGSVGLGTVLKNFPKLVKQMFYKASGLEEEDIDRARTSTSLHMFTFGERARPIDGVPDFVSFTDQDLHSSCSVAVKQMGFDEGETNVESAIEYVSGKAHSRFLSTRESDEAAGKRRVACVVLITDGSVNSGERSARKLIADADARLSDSCRGNPLAFYAIGLGESTNPSFLTSFTRGGFWKHVTNPHDPVGAFDTTVGTILSSVGVYDVTLQVSVERDGELLKEEQTSTTKTFGLMTRGSCRARIVDVRIPPGAIPGDVLEVVTTFGGTAEPIRSRIPVGTSSMASGVTSHLKIANMSDGLFAEAREIEQALEKLKESVVSGKDFHDASDSLVKTSHGSRAVQSQVLRYTDILENSLLCPSSAGTMAFVPPSVGGGAPPAVYRSTPSRWMVESSFSQLDS